MKNKITTSILLTTLALAILLSVNFALPVLAVPPAPLLLDPKVIPKFQNQLTGPPPVYAPTMGNNYTVDVTEFMQQILPPGWPMTKVWGYGGMIVGGTYFRNAPGATFEAVRNVPINVTWQNKLTGNHLFPVDPTLHWADPNNFGMPGLPFNPYPPGYSLAQSPVPIIPHLHGGEVHSTSDGHPEAWFTWDGKYGMEYSSNQIYGNPTRTPGEAVFYYPNEQPPTTLWYHDHALGITRINVLSGLAGFYLLRDYPNDLAEQALVASAGVTPQVYRSMFDIPLVIQDRTFYIDGSFFFPTVGINPTIHPYWMPEFFGNTIMVNGKVWPNMNVEPGVYRFRFLDGSNARFYTLSFWQKNKNLPFTQIGSDGGYLYAPAAGLTQITIAPGERIDILVDFTGLAPGTTILLKNTAKAPFPAGAPPDPQTVGQVMQFTVQDTAAPNPAVPALPTPLNPTLSGLVFPTLTGPIAKTRILTLIEVMGPAGPAEILLDGQKWMAPAGVSEKPANAKIEKWVIVNPTADTHPIHLHLVQFQLVSRQPFQAGKYLKAWMANNPVNPATGMPPLTGPTVWPGNDAAGLAALAPYLQKTPIVPGPGVFTTEQGWKDTIQVHPGEITTIIARWAPIDQTAAPPGGSTPYPFDPTTGPGYVWHCHILDHEDNEMMRPYMVT